eukprot:TRINITY_DN79354_c0_g1_i1.p1 TRINITY_DN79354_c0_g1~~TRINITY_DN79354_c0_g1_i1.p1  ORF type:complete len:510 (-),score=85.12 TRINITY_DN79354_c0_g1_i1:73-1602(-)
MKLSGQGALLIIFLNFATCRASSAEALSFFALDSDSGATEKLLSMIPERRTLESIEDTVLKLANKKSTADPQASSLAPFVQSILNITENTLKQNIIQRCNDTQARLDNLSSGHTCDDFHPGNSSRLTDLYALNKTHIECRLREAEKYREIEEECISVQNEHDAAFLASKALCDACQSKKVYPDYRQECKMASDESAPTIGNYLNSMRDRFKYLYDDLVFTCSKCDPVKTSTTSTTTSTSFQPPCFPNNEAMRKARCEYEDLNLQCDTFQAQFEEKACEYKHLVSCSRYNGCMDNFEAQFNQTTIDEAKLQEKAYELEWRAVLRIECLLTALVNATDLKAAIDTCKATSRVQEADAAIVLNYPPLPANRTSCTYTDAWLQPGTPNFGWYSVLPNDVSALSCAASCCGSPNFTASYPDGVTSICPFESCTGVTPHNNMAFDNVPLCKDFTYKDNCASNGGRRKCPPSAHIMCAGSGCDGGTDHCCATTDDGCEEYGGPLVCAFQENNSAVV